MIKTNKILAIASITALVLGGFALTASTVVAQDTNELQKKQDEQVAETAKKASEQTWETQKKTAEQAREAEKEDMENATETEKKAGEQAWETQKKLLERTRETEKKNAENATETEKKANEQAREAQKNEKELEKEAQNASSSNEEEDDDATEHRSIVAGFVEKLHEIASSTPGGLGEQVREVAKVQDELKDKTADALKTVESRSAFMKFLIGANQQNVEALKSSVTTLQNHIDKLNEIKSQTTGTVQSSLNDEINVLAKEKDRVQSVVNENQNKSGIFGWFVRFFQ